MGRRGVWGCRRRTHAHGVGINLAAGIHPFICAMRRPENAPAKVSKDQIRTWLLLSQPEMIAIVAGVDPVTGANFEAVQSYTHEDIIWDHRSVAAPHAPGRS